MLEIEKIISKDEVSIASTYLNISAILSSLGKHKESLKFAKQANALYLKLKEEKLSTKTEQDSHTPAEETFRTNFIISFFNMATELQILGMRGQANDMYIQGHEFAMMDLGPAHPLTEKLWDIKQSIDKDAHKVSRQRSSRSTTQSSFNEQGRTTNSSAFKAYQNNSKKSSVR